jgi:hypothetical protein
MSLCPTTGAAMVLLTSGIVDEVPARRVPVLLSTVLSVRRRGVEPGGAGAWWWV